MLVTPSFRRFAVVLLALVPATAAAQDELSTKRACAASYEQAQRLRQDGKLLEAREEAVQCAQSTCPALLTSDCARWVDELDQALPSVIVDARDEAGKELPGLRVILDGRELPQQRSGLAFSLNPGPHRFRFQAAGHAPVELEELVVQGRKNQAVEVKLKALAPLAQTTYRGLVWGTEVLLNSENRPVGGFPDDQSATTPLVFRQRNAVGLYSYIEPRVTRRYYPGFLFQWVQDINPGIDATFSYSPYLTVWASEFQRIRLQYTRLEAPGQHDNEFFLQWTVILGSHVHSFKDR